MVPKDMLKQLGWSDELAEMFHSPDGDGGVVDQIIDDDPGLLTSFDAAGFATEIKISGSPVGAASLQFKAR